MVPLMLRLVYHPASRGRSTIGQIATLSNKATQNVGRRPDWGALLIKNNNLQCPPRHAGHAAPAFVRQPALDTNRKLQYTYFGLQYALGRKTPLPSPGGRHPARPR